MTDAQRELLETLHDELWGSIERHAPDDVWTGRSPCNGTLKRWFEMMERVLEENINGVADRKATE